MLLVAEVKKAKNTTVARQRHLLTAWMDTSPAQLKSTMCFLYQVVPSLRVMKTIMKWWTWNTPATTAEDSLWAAELTAMSARTLTCALAVTMQRSILTGNTLIVLFLIFVVLFHLAQPISRSTYIYLSPVFHLVICPLIGSQCTLWLPYGSATVTVWSSLTSTTTLGCCLLLSPSTHQSWAARRQWMGLHWTAAPWGRPQPCRPVAHSSLLTVCSKGRLAKVIVVFLSSLK